MHSQSALCLISRHMLLLMTCHQLLLETGQATKTDEHVHRLITTVFEIRGVHFALEQLKEHYLWTYCLSELGRPGGSDVNGPHSHVYIDPCPASESKSPSDSRSRRTTKNKRAMKLAISVLFLAAASTGAPSVTLRRTMPTGHAENTLAENQKQTAMKIQNKVTPWIQHLEKILKLSIERQHNETSQLYKYIDDSIAHATSEVVKRITDLKENTDESLKALEENTKENLNSLKTITNDNNKKIIETTVNSNNSALALSLDWMSRRMDATEVRIYNLSSKL